MAKIVKTTINPTGADMIKFGHIELDVSEKELLSVFQFGDALKITIEAFDSFEMPFYHYYDQVGIGELVLCTYTKSSAAVIARNYRSLGVEIGLCKVDTEKGNFRLKDDIKCPISVTIEPSKNTIKQPDFKPINCEKTGNQRFDFREVSGNGIRKGILYRSSSPVDHRFTNCEIVDGKAKEVSVKSVINLSDTKDEAEGFPGFYKTYCSHCKTVYLNIPLNVTSPIFMNALSKGFDFILQNEPPFLIFCTEGRDRTGLFVAILQALCGTEVSTIISDYVYSFSDFDEPFIANPEKSLMNNLCTIFGAEKIDLDVIKSFAEKYSKLYNKRVNVIGKIQNKIGGQK